MADVLVGDDEVTLRLRGWERWAALHGDITVPRSSVRGVAVVAKPFDHLRGLRLPGTCVPRRLCIGTWQAKGVRDFVAVGFDRPAVMVALDPAGAGGWTRMIVSVDDPQAVGRQLLPSSSPTPAPVTAATAPADALPTADAPPTAERPRPKLRPRRVQPLNPRPS